MKCLILVVNDKFQVKSFLFPTRFEFLPEKTFKKTKNSCLFTLFIHMNFQKTQKIHKTALFRKKFVFKITNYEYLKSHKCIEYSFIQQNFFLQLLATSIYPSQAVWDKYTLSRSKKKEKTKICFLFRSTR